MGISGCRKHFKWLIGLIYLMVVGAGTIGSGMENFNGTLRLGTVYSEIDSNRVQSLDQQYTLNYFRPMFPGSKMRISCFFSGLQTDQPGMVETWHGEFQPSGDLSWSNSFFGIGVNYGYRETHDTFMMNDLLSRRAGGVFRTRFVNFPQSTFRYDWNRTYSSIISQPQTAEEKRLQYSVNYSKWNSRIYYSYTNRDYNNLTADLRQNLQQHLVRLDYAHSLFGNRLKFSSGYLFNFTRRREETGVPAEPLIQINTYQGLYAEDSTPEFGALDTLWSLIDQNTTDSTSPPIDIGGALVNQNIGFDLGISRHISLIYIYTDRLSDPDEGWAVYTSDDNLEWSRLSNGVSSDFNSPQRRYEISFSSTEARYFKAVNSGVNEEPQVFVTEIQAFLSSQAAEQGPQDMQNHRVTVNTSFQLHRSISVGCDVLYGSIPDNSLGNGRQDASFNGNVTYHPNQKFTANARYMRDLVDYLNSSIGSRGTETYSTTFSAKPLETVDASLVASQMINFEDNQENQRIKAGRFRITTAWIPTFSTTSEFGFTRDSRILDNYTIDTWIYGVSATAQLLRNLHATGSLRLQDYDSNLPYNIDQTKSMEIEADYRATSTISFRSTGRIDQEGDNKEVTQEHSFNWNLTSKISTYTEARWTDSNSNYETFSFSFQNSFNPTNRTSLTLSYNFNRISSNEISENSSYRVGFNTSF